MTTNIDLVKWNEIQEKIWHCDTCHKNERVAINIRQQTQAPTRLVKLMLIGVAPPYTSDIGIKTIADSATSDSQDNLRNFILNVLGGQWESLLERGLLLVHCVKCAIVPKDRHQNPSIEVVDSCATRHFVQEVLLTHPSVVVVFGKAPFRAILTVPDVRSSVPSGLGLSCSVADLVRLTKGGITINTKEWHFRMYGSPFPLLKRQQAAEILRDAARYVGILR